MGINWRVSSPIDTGRTMRIICAAIGRTITCFFGSWKSAASLEYIIKANETLNYSSHQHGSPREINPSLVNCSELFWLFKSLFLCSSFCMSFALALVRVAYAVRVALDHRLASTEFLGLLSVREAQKAFWQTEESISAAFRVESRENCGWILVMIRQVAKIDHKTLEWVIVSL